jgi:hypothetical protein
MFFSSARIMNTDNLGVSVPGVGVTNDPYGHHHLAHHPHLLPPHHSQHPSAIYCSSSNPYTELFSPYSSDFVTSHDTGNNTGVPTDYLTLQNSLDYVVSHHHHHHHQQQQQQQQHHLHQMTTSTNGERTPSSVGTGITGSDSSPSHSFATSSGYSSAADYYNTSLLNSKTGLNNTNTSNTNNNNNTNNNTPTTNTSSHSPYDGTSTASTSSPPQSTGYLTTAVKQETMMPGSFAIDPHSNYGTNQIYFLFFFAF